MLSQLWLQYYVWKSLSLWLLCKFQFRSVQDLVCLLLALLIDGYPFLVVTCSNLVVWILGIYIVPCMKKDYSIVWGFRFILQLRHLHCQLDSQKASVKSPTHQLGHGWPSRQRSAGYIPTIASLHCNVNGTGQCGGSGLLFDTELNRTGAIMGHIYESMNPS